MKAPGFLFAIITFSFMVEGCSKSSSVVGAGNTVDWYESGDAGPFVSLVSDGQDLIGSGIKGVFLSTDCGLTWMPADTGLPLSGIYHVAVEGSTLIAGVDSPEGAFISTDEGATWAKDDSGLVPLPNIKIPGTYENIASMDNGTNWRQADSGLANSYHQQGLIPYVESMATNGRKIYSGAFNSELFVSKNFGASWTDISQNLPANPGSGVYVGVEDSCLVAGTDKGVYFSTNDGTTWTDISGSITTPVVASLFVTHGFIFVSTDDGVVWRTPIRGSRWERF